MWTLHFGQLNNLFPISMYCANHYNDHETRKISRTRPIINSTKLTLWLLGVWTGHKSLWAHKSSAGLPSIFRYSWFQNCAGLSISLNQHSSWNNNWIIYLRPITYAPFISSELLGVLETEIFYILDYLINDSIILPKSIMSNRCFIMEVFVVEWLLS